MAKGKDQFLWAPSVAGGEVTLSPGDITVRADGVRVWTAAGREFIDCNSGLWNVSLGYGNPDILKAAYRGLATLSGATLFGRLHEPAIQLCRELVAVAPRYRRFFLTSSGSEACDTAIRIVSAFWLARRQSRRHFAHLPGSYHGVTVGSLNLLGLPGYRHTDIGAIPSLLLPDPWHDTQRSLDELVDLFQEHGSEIAAVFIEPVQGSGGVRAVPSEYATALAALARDSGTLVVVDEISCGLYRAGPLWVSDELELEPDVLLTGKGLGGGVFPIAAVGVTGEIFETVTTSPETRMLAGFTYGGHPLACNIASAVLAILSSATFSANRLSSARALAKGLFALKGLPGVDDVRGSGHMFGVCVSPTAVSSRGGSYGWSGRLQAAGLREGLLIHPLRAGVLPILPSLTMVAEETLEMCARLRAVLLNY